jgi:hypothetical protein
MHLIRHPDGTLSLSETANDAPAPGRFARGPRNMRVSAWEIVDPRSYTYAPPYGDVGPEWPPVTVVSTSYAGGANLVAVPGPDGKPLTEEGLADLSLDQFLDLPSYLPPALRGFARDGFSFTDGAFHFIVPRIAVQLVPRYLAFRRQCVVDVLVHESRAPMGPLAFDAWSLDNADELVREAGYLVAGGSVARAAGISNVEYATTGFSFDAGMEAWVAGGMGFGLDALDVDALFAVASLRKALRDMKSPDRRSPEYVELISRTVEAVQSSIEDADHLNDDTVTNQAQYAVGRLALLRLRKAAKDAPRG